MLPAASSCSQGRAPPQGCLTCARLSSLFYKSTSSSSLRSFSFPPHRHDPLRIELAPLLAATSVCTTGVGAQVAVLQDNGGSDFTSYQKRKRDPPTSHNFLSRSLRSWLLPVWSLSPGRPCTTAPAANLGGCLQDLRRWCWSRQQPAAAHLCCLCTSRNSSSCPPHVAIFNDVAFHWHLHRLDGIIAAVLPHHCFSSRDACLAPFRRRRFPPVDVGQQHTGECPRRSLDQARH